MLLFRFSPWGIYAPRFLLLEKSGGDEHMRRLDAHDPRLSFSSLLATARHSMSMLVSHYRCFFVLMLLLSSVIFTIAITITITSTACNIKRSYVDVPACRRLQVAGGRARQVRR